MAIIAVMVAIAIPTFSKQLEKSREGTDISNIRAAYAAVASEAMLDPKSELSLPVTLVQTQNSWQSDNTISIAGVPLSKISVTAGGTVTVYYVPTLATDGGGIFYIGAKTDDGKVPNNFAVVTVAAGGGEEEGGEEGGGEATAVTLGNATKTASFDTNTITVSGVKALFTSLEPNDAEVAFANATATDNVTVTGGEGITVSSASYTGDTLTITLSDSTGVTSLAVTFKATKTDLTDGTGTLTITIG